MRKGSIVLGVPLAMILASVTAGAPVVAQPDGTGTVRVVVKYETPSGNEPLSDVDVWLGIAGAADRGGCTDEEGIVRFAGVPADVVLYSATGPGGCENAGFRNPDTGDHMTVVTWEDHHGVLTWDAFSVGDGDVATLRYVARTPGEQRELCQGYLATWLGTAGPDRSSGTSANEVFVARGGDDVIRGGGGIDFSCGGPGADTLRGEAAMDWLFGQSGADELIGGAGRDAVFGGPGSDRCVGEREEGCER